VVFHIGAHDDSLASNHSMPNAIVGRSDPVDDTLKKLYYSREIK
jgi:hypothetical protein